MRSRTATASRSASVASRCWPALALAVIVLAAGAPASAGMKLDEFRGHLSVGYGKLVITESPAGSLAFSGGLDYPLAGAWRAGVDIGYSLLGTRIVESGTQAGELDYSVFEVLALAHWIPRRGPVGIVSFGPGVFHGRADLTSSAPATFDQFAVERTVVGAALSGTLIARGAAPVRAGLELGVRTMYLPDPRYVLPGTRGLPEDAWTIVSGRLTIHY